MLKTKIFQVIPENLKSINNFLDRSDCGSIARQEFVSDEENRLYLITTIIKDEMMKNG